LKKLIMTALVCLSVIGIAGVAASSSLAAGNSAPKATGDITFMNIAYPLYGIDATQGHWVFTAQGQGSAVKGNMTYTDGYGSYTANVTALQVNGHDATITAQFTSSTTPYAQVGQSSTWIVHDVAEPGVGNDYFSVPGTPAGSFDEPTITAGNIQVHA
jgi:hypothetical protein